MTRYSGSNNINRGFQAGYDASKSVNGLQKYTGLFIAKVIDIVDDRYEGFSFPIDNDVSRFASRNSELRRKIGLIKYERDELSRLYEELIAKNLQLRNENKSFLEEGDCDLRTSADYIRFDFTGTDDNQDPIYQRVFLLNEIALMLKEIKVLQNDNRRIEDLNTGWDLIMKLED